MKWGIGLVSKHGHRLLHVGFRPYWHGGVQGLGCTLCSAGVRAPPHASAACRHALRAASPPSHPCSRRGCGCGGWQARGTCTAARRGRWMSTELGRRWLRKWAVVEWASGCAARAQAHRGAGLTACSRAQRLIRVGLNRAPQVAGLSAPRPGGGSAAALGPPRMRYDTHRLGLGLGLLEGPSRQLHWKKSKSWRVAQSTRQRQPSTRMPSSCSHARSASRELQGRPAWCGGRGGRRRRQRGAAAHGPVRQRRRRSRKARCRPGPQRRTASGSGLALASASRWAGGWLARGAAAEVRWATGLRSKRWRAGRAQAGGRALAERAPNLPVELHQGHAGPGIALNAQNLAVTLAFVPNVF